MEKQHIRTWSLVPLIIALLMIMTFSFGTVALPAQVVRAQTTNLALNRPVTCSSTENAGTACANAVDGNTGTRWSSAFSDPQWIQVDLGASYNLTSVTLRWEAAYGKSFQIQASNDAATWTNIYTTTTGAGGVQTLTVSGSGRYVRMYGTVRATQYGYSLWEFEVYGTSGATATRTRTPTLTNTPVNSSLPDLTITSITYVGSTPPCANNPRDNVVVANIGTVGAGSFTVSFGAYTQTVTSLAAGTSTTLSFPAVSSVTATADSTNVIAESNESNNSMSASLPIPTQAPTCTPTGTATYTPTTGGSLPDLTVLSITEFSYNNPTPTANAQGCWPGGPTNAIGLRVTVQNIGSASAGTFVVNLLLNGSNYSQTVSGLAAGATLAVDISPVPLPSTRSATVDFTNLVTESNETNNTLTLVPTGPTVTATRTGTAPPTICRTPTPTSSPTVTPTATLATRTLTPTRTATSGSVCGTTNLALNRPAISSSNENAGTTPNLAVDGNATGTRWSSAASDPQWIQIDLGATYSICHVRLTWEAAYARSYQIQLSNDAATWTTIYSTTTGDGGVDDLTGLSGTGRYIRMNGTVRATGYGYSLWEFEVYALTGPSPTPTRTATTGPTATSVPLGNIVPLYNSSTVLEPETIIDTGTAIITRISDRARDRHARESEFAIYDHYLSFYWEDRTASIEIVDHIAKGGNDIVVNITSLWPLDTPDFRAFFRGVNTKAEYWFNVDSTQIDPTHYTATVTYNAGAGRAPVIGDRMEIEFSQFLLAPPHGRANYYGTAMLYIIGQGGFVPWEGQGANLDSYPLSQSAWQGGRTTLPYQYSNEPLHRFKQMAQNMAPQNGQPFMLGRRLFHTDFSTGAHSELPDENPIFTEQIGKLGPRFYAANCVGCHVNDGRGLPPAVGTTITNMVVKVGNASGGADPNLGGSLQPLNNAGASEGSAQISSWTTINGTYGDGTAYQLQKPNYTFTGPVPTNFSVRDTPQLVGMGLLEAVSESTIAGLADPNDANGDGISGRMQTVIDPVTGQTRLGRFGWKAGKASVAQQIASALTNDMGVTNSIFPNPDCGSAQTGCGASGTELNNADLDNLVRYISLLGVGARRNLNDAQAMRGETLFASAKCTACHTPTLTTSAYAPMTELRNQTIHPYTDLLLHDMGPGLADNLPEGVASGSEWRTAPLWSIGFTPGVSGGEAYLHDGRARTLAEAILWHSGEAEAAKEAFRTMSASDRAALIAFLISQ